MEKPVFQRAYDRLSEVNADEKMRVEYENREKAIRDWNNEMRAERKEGEALYARLVQRLLEEKRYDDIKRSAADQEYRSLLYKQYGIER